MESITKQLSKVVARIALKVAVQNANSTCVYHAHQPKLPESVKKLRKV